jgi:hypothetical protein
MYSKIFKAVWLLCIFCRWFLTKNKSQTSCLSSTYLKRMTLHFAEIHLQSLVYITLKMGNFVFLSVCFLHASYTIYTHTTHIILNPSTWRRLSHQEHIQPKIQATNNNINDSYPQCGCPKNTSKMKKEKSKQQQHWCDHIKKNDSTSTLMWSHKEKQQHIHIDVIT